MRIAGQKTVKIKFEVDTDPPLRFSTEEKLLVQPYSFYAKCFAPSDLFAGKMHALMFRKWKNRVKGRDWFDFECYVRQGHALNLDHFAERARQSGDWSDEELSIDRFRQLLAKRIDSLDVTSALKDVERFVPEPTALNIWSQDYFHQLANMIRFTG